MLINWMVLYMYLYEYFPVHRDVPKPAPLPTVIYYICIGMNVSYMYLLTKHFNTNHFYITGRGREDSEAKTAWHNAMAALESFEKRHKTECQAEEITLLDSWSINSKISKHCEIEIPNIESYVTDLCDIYPAVGNCGHANDLLELKNVDCDKQLIEIPSTDEAGSTCNGGYIVIVGGKSQRMKFINCIMLHLKVKRNLSETTAVNIEAIEGAPAVRNPTSWGMITHAFIHIANSTVFKPVRYFISQLFCRSRYKHIPQLEGTPKVEMNIYKGVSPQYYRQCAFRLLKQELENVL